MANYSIKLCDHSGATSTVTQSIQSELQGFFTRVFAGTSDNATVAWGTGSASDDIVLHFVEDVAHSYIVQAFQKKRPPNINPLAGGHTSLRDHKICSEFYKTVTGKNGKVRPMSGRDYAKLAFHESLHNVFPGWTEQDLMGHGGLADTPVGSDLNQWDIDTMRKGISIKSVATQQL
jgi:hypothetical protein